jgi:hypothetical protein
VLIGSGGSAELDQNGTVAVAPNSTAVIVTAGGVTQAITAGTTTSWRASGYYQPVDVGGVWNTMKAGATVPMKFELFYGPRELTDASLVASTVAQVSCPTSGVTTDDVEELTSLTGLRYDTTAGEFHLNWKSPSTRGSCWKVTVAQGNAMLTALFKLR